MPKERPSAFQPTPVKKGIEIPNLEEEKRLFHETIIGQDRAIEQLAFLLETIRSGIRAPVPGPIDNKFFAGPSGVGKTESVYTFIKLLMANTPQPDGVSDPRAKAIRIDCADYQKDHNVARLIGSPPGYLGHDSPDNKAGSKPKFAASELEKKKIYYTDRNGKVKSLIVVLMDEAEKAHEDLHKAFLAVLTTGKMEMGNNTVSDFSDAVIIYTSNLGNRDVEQALAKGGQVGQEQIDLIYKDAFQKHFPPEFRGRIEELVVFEHLTREQIKKVVGVKLCSIEEGFEQSGIPVELQTTPEGMDWLVRNGYNRSEGARALEKAMKNAVREPLILASGQSNFKNQTVVIDADNPDAEELTFYTVEQTFDEQEIERSLQVSLETSRQFFLDNNLPEFAQLLPDKITITPAISAQVREALEAGFTQSFVFPPLEGFDKESQKIFETMSAKSNFLPEDKQYKSFSYQALSNEDAKAANITLSQLVKEKLMFTYKEPYLLFYSNDPMATNTTGKSVEEIENEGIVCPQLYEFLILQRQEAEIRGNHDYFSLKDDNTAHATWLRAQKGVLYGFVSKENTIVVRQEASRGKKYANVGTRPVKIVRLQ